MKVEIKVPAVGESVTEATVARIIKQNGSFVEKNEEILELETDKVNQVVTAPEKGVLSLLVTVDQKVKISEVIGSIEPASIPSKPQSAPAAVEVKKEEVKKEVSFVKEAIRIPTEQYLKEQKKEEPAKKMEAPLPCDKKAPCQTPSGKRVRMSGLRRTIAQKLVEVKNTTAMLTTFNEVDMSAVMKIRSDQKDQFEKKFGVKLGFLSFFVTACSSALKAFPEVNAYIEKDEIVYNDSHHIGIAVSTEKGLFVPVLRDCQSLSFAQIESEVMVFAKKAREGSIGIADLQGGTFTITNGGVFGSLLSTPILNPPQSAILGMHKIQERPVAVGGQVVIRPMMYLALSYDHRIIDGKEAVGFLVHIKECLENPSKLLLES